MIARLFRGREIDLRVPAAGQLLNRRDIHRAVVQIGIDLGQVFGDESAVDRDRIAGQRGFSSARGILMEVLQDLSARLFEGNTVRNLGDQARGGVHLADEIVHASDLLRGGLDDEVDAFA